jgi:hypothetical protein
MQTVKHALQIEALAKAGNWRHHGRRGAAEISLSFCLLLTLSYRHVPYVK